ncbi:hypothetical protein BVAD3_24510 [Bacillus velezensis]|nr:hypothetical protein BVAD3_24510 [Bacillus velezensis]
MDNIPLFYWISICFANEFGKNAACPEKGENEISLFIFFIVSVYNSLYNRIKIIL